MSRKRHIEAMDRPGYTRCGHQITDGRFSLSMQTRNNRANCERCRLFNGRPRYEGSPSNANTIIVRDGKRIPKSSIESLERPRPAPNYGDNPRPGPPYPWEGI